MKAAEICIHTKRLLEEKGELYGTVHSIFHKVCNIETSDHGLIPLISDSMPNVPRSISFKLPGQQSMESLGLFKGEGMILNGAGLESTESGFRLELAEAKLWDGRPDFRYKRVEQENFLQNVEVLRHVLIHKGKLNGIAPIVLDVDAFMGKIIQQKEEGLRNHYCTFIQGRILKLIQGICSMDGLPIEDTAKQIIGFGPGLTPSADDLLAGMMIATIYGGHYFSMDVDEIISMNQSMIEGTQHRTTKISTEMLYFASKGEACAHTKKLMECIYAEQDRKILENHAQSVIEKGETSGSDLLAGIYIGCLISIWKNRERVMGK